MPPTLGARGLVRTGLSAAWLYNDPGTCVIPPRQGAPRFRRIPDAAISGGSDVLVAPWAPRLVRVGEPALLRFLRAATRWPSVRGWSSSAGKTAVSPQMTTERPPLSTTTTCEPGVWPGAGTTR